MVNEIKIIDSGKERYSIEPKKLILGRMYDNDADTIKIERPIDEIDSICTMIITDQVGKVIDHVIMENDEYLIKSAITQNRLIQIGFSFSRRDGYIKNSEIILGEFLTAQKPYGFVPVEPEQKKSIDYLISYGFTDSKLVGNELQFFNMNGDKVVAFDLSDFTQAQSDLGETDVSRETFVKGKTTKNLKNEGEDGSSPYATQDWTQKNAGKIDSINETELGRQINLATDLEVGKLYLLSGLDPTIIRGTYKNKNVYFYSGKPYFPNYYNYQVLKQLDNQLIFENCNLTPVVGGAGYNLNASYYQYARVTIDTTTGLITNIEPVIMLKGVNGGNLSANCVGIYAPTTSGTQGQILQSNGSDSAPTWIDKSPLIISNTSVASWTSDTTYSDFGYKSEISITGLSANDVCEIIFNQADASSGNYAQVNSTSAGILTIYSKVDTSITIPTIIVFKGGD